MLVCYARELKEDFASYAEEVVKIMVSHLKFYFHDSKYEILSWFNNWQGHVINDWITEKNNDNKKRWYIVDL